MGRAPTRGLYPFENTALRIKAQPIFKKTRDTWGRRQIRIVQKYEKRLRLERRSLCYLPEVIDYARITTTWSSGTYLSHNHPFIAQNVPSRLSSVPVCVHLRI